MQPATWTATLQLCNSGAPDAYRRVNAGQTGYSEETMVCCHSMMPLLLTADDRSKAARVAVAISSCETPSLVA